jgi:hypothetical protein
MKPILFSVQDAHSTAFTRGIEPIMEIDGMHFVKSEFHQRHINIHIQDGLAWMMSNGVQVVNNQAMLRHYRYRKPEYNNLFNDVAKRLKLKGWRNVESYVDSFAIPEHTFIGGPTSYLLRPHMGARGLGFIEFPFPETTANAVETLVSKWCKEEITDEYFEQTLKKIGGKISQSPNTKMEEVKSCLKEGFDFVKVVSDVKKEYRILTDHQGKPALVVEREQNDYGLKIKQASGGYQNTDKIIPMDQFKQSNADLCKELTKFFDNVDFPIHSFDLFVTQNGHWGFFEACSQFGCTTVPDGWVRKETRALLSSIAKQLKLK